LVRDTRSRCLVNLLITVVDEPSDEGTDDVVDVELGDDSDVSVRDIDEPDDIEKDVDSEELSSKYVDETVDGAPPLAQSPPLSSAFSSATSMLVLLGDDWLLSFDSLLTSAGRPAISIQLADRCIVVCGSPDLFALLLASEAV
jgi:hypothetical protein